MCVIMHWHVVGKDSQAPPIVVIVRIEKQMIEEITIEKHVAIVGLAILVCTFSVSFNIIKVSAKNFNK
jgi:hypothetical protein